LMKVETMRERFYKLDFLSREATPSETSSEHNMATTEQGEEEGNNAILREIKRGNEALSQKLDTKTAEINQAILGLRSSIDGLGSRVTEAEERISSAEDKLSELNSHVLGLLKERASLVDKVDQLENQSRRNNIRIVNLKEGVEGADPVRFFTDWIPTVLGQQNFPKPLVIERVHRSPTFRQPGAKRPRPILVRFLSYLDRDRILQTAATVSREKGELLTPDGSTVMFFPDLSANLVKRRR
uniref:L1 transposable element RRM domain-containing protein n=1 Tax=Paramormyrops kingsleyae TaxID=1676925 RepID=A0A3B3RI25_9TELE